VLHSTRYARLEGVVSGLELATGAAVNEVMQYPPPDSILTKNSNVVRGRYPPWGTRLTDGSNIVLGSSGECCVVCEGIQYLMDDRDVPATNRWEKIPLTVHGENPVSWDRFCRPIDQSSHFEDIQGATLEWWGLTLSHSILFLVATGLPGEPFALRFNYTQYVDCPTLMHNMSLRMATAEEREALRGRASPRVTSYIDREPGRGNCASSGKEALVTIECDEGLFTIWAGMLFLSWRDRGRRRESSLFDPVIKLGW